MRIERDESTISDKCSDDEHPGEPGIASINKQLNVLTIS
jgi:hypothetical protein